MVAGLGTSACPLGPQPSSLLSALDPVEPLNSAGQVGHISNGGEFAG